ncbi:unnamed protein product [Pleuronectes platessa]|uniref:Uncharacterized protein n=1 Tax=Pleuronectes platessa TaxID=8262 RepID=A0A9N7U260_PLEPL|nr:unnamed protein product [Pleuronectes platessa]
MAPSKSLGGFDESTSSSSQIFRTVASTCSKEDSPSLNWDGASLHLPPTGNGQLGYTATHALLRATRLHHPSLRLLALSLNTIVTAVDNTPQSLQAKKAAASESRTVM